VPVEEINTIETEKCSDGMFIEKIKMNPDNYRDEK
jgi:hypothetical protein